LTSTKHSARTPDSTRKSVSAVGLSKLQTSDPEIDDSESAVGDLDESRVKRSKRRTNSSINAADSRSTTSTSSSGGISMSMSQKDQSISDLCNEEMPESLIFDDYFEMRLDASTSSSLHHGRSVSELSEFSETSNPKRQMGSGVILLAQRLMNGSQDKTKTGSMSYKHQGSNDDFCYHTAPQGISPVESVENHS